MHDAGHSCTFASIEHEGLQIREAVFYALAWGDPQLSWEHSEFRWCTLDEAMNLLLWPENKEALQKTYALAIERYN